MKRISIFVLSAILLIGMAVPAFAASETPFAAFIQAESLTMDGESAKIVDNSGAIGGKAVEIKVAAMNASGDGFTLKFTVPKDGTYTVWGRMYAPAQTSNSFFYSVDGAADQVWDMIDVAETGTESLSCYGTWYYMYLTYRQKPYDSEIGIDTAPTLPEWRHSPNYLTLTKGEHEIHITGREAGSFIDEFVITELDLSEYDPNYFEGNTYSYTNCSFCHVDKADCKHYVKDIYAVKGKTAESQFAVYSADTADFIIVPAILAGASLVTGLTVAKKKRR